jgi:Uncharacterized alpha/beta hydrolase domain (DUF2235)
MKHVCYFRHALALDERRVKFLPEYAYGGAATRPKNAENNKGSPINHESSHNGHNLFSGDTYDPIANKELSDDRPPIDNKATDSHSSARRKSMENRPHYNRSLVCRNTLRYVSAFSISARRIALVIF